jgi:hypothetical protein
VDGLVHPGEINTEGIGAVLRSVLHGPDPATALVTGNMDTTIEVLRVPARARPAWASCGGPGGRTDGDHGHDVAKGLVGAVGRRWHHVAEYEDVGAVLAAQVGVKAVAEEGDAFGVVLHLKDAPDTVEFDDRARAGWNRVLGRPRGSRRLGDLASARRAPAVPKGAPRLELTGETPNSAAHHRIVSCVR